MRSISLFVLYTSVVVTTAFTFPNNDVDASCNCRPLRECSSLLSKLITSHSTDAVKHRAFTKYLHLINCGYVRSEPLVCCPEKIPSEILEIVDDKKYWTASQQQNSIIKLRLAIENAKSPSLNNVDPFPECGLHWQGEDTNSNVTSLGKYPWLALLEYKTSDKHKQILCGGVLISDQHILTSGHCVRSNLNLKLVSVILGEYDTNTNPDCIHQDRYHEPLCVDSVKKYNISSSIIHHKYDQGLSFLILPSNNDTSDVDLYNIGLIKLKEKVQFTKYIQPICLPLGKPNYKNFQVAGWGRTHTLNVKGFNKTLISYVTQCKPDDYKKFAIRRIYDESELICVTASKNSVEQPCVVDSGGPLIGFETSESGRTRPTVFGIMYAIMPCEQDEEQEALSGIFTNVYTYKSWIIKHMKS
ncbi:phenoloxidase-activating factor 1-like [Phymastichus coffea]|uniref:phenoloxidase-activating factor 1-like n=1 Tax=Phymastichus coffea TaxID=108790 RepID=UPI00273C2BE2|nr:phenoloxidase-activating factor 1-like [Phymastichus coffea]